jgi:hypothetical protein
MESLTNIGPIVEDNAAISDFTGAPIDFIEPCLCCGGVGFVEAAQ